jgi:hypothetical protein
VVAEFRRRFAQIKQELAANQREKRESFCCIGL